MEALLTYFIQVNVLLVILYLGYLLLLRSLTFYQLNRYYFGIGGLFALGYPFLDIVALFKHHVEPVGELVAYLPGILPAEPTTAIHISLQHLVLAVIGLGAGLLFGKFLIQLWSLYRIHRNSEHASWREYIYRNVFFPIAPFSFLNRIYLNKEQHADTELQDILAHERVHVRGYHTLDILLFEILIMICWYNPILWLMRRSVRQNLEFLTDQQVINTGVDKQAYQYALLQVSKQGETIAIANQFNFKLLKSRIMMMNKKRSSRLAISKYICLIPLIIFVAAAFTVSKADSKIAEVVQLTQQTTVNSLSLNSPSLEERTPLVSVTSSQDTSKHAPKSVKGTVLGMSIQADAAGAAKVLGDTLSSARKPVFVIRGNKSRNGEFPLYVVNGVKKPIEFDVQEINPNDIAEIYILKGEQAINTYGNEAKDGVISVTLKGYQGKRELSLESKGEKPAGAILSQPSKNQSSVVKIRGVNAGADAPLFIVDGVLVDQAEGKLENLNPDEIKSISVVKDAKSLAEYGDKAKGGLIIISTKEGKQVQP